MARSPSQGVLLGEELLGHAQRLGEQHRRGHRRAPHVPARHAADHDGQLADDRQGVQGEQRVDVAAQTGAVDQGQGAYPGRVGQGQAQGDRTAHGVPHHVQRPDPEGVEEVGHERGQVPAGSVAGDRRGALAVAGQAQGQHPMGAGEHGQYPPPARGALLVAVQQQQRRPGPGLQVLQVHPVHDDPTVVNDELTLVLADGLGRNGPRADRHEAPLVRARRGHQPSRHRGPGQPSSPYGTSPGMLNRRSFGPRRSSERASRSPNPAGPAGWAQQGPAAGFSVGRPEWTPRRL